MYYSSSLSAQRPIKLAQNKYNANCTNR